MPGKSLSSSSSMGAGITRNIQTLCLQGTSCEGRRQSEADYNQTISTLCDCPGRKQAQDAVEAQRKRCLSFPGDGMKKKISEYRPLMKLRPPVYMSVGGHSEGGSLYVNGSYLTF